MARYPKRRKLRTSAVVLLVALVLCAAVLVVYLIMGYLQDNKAASSGSQPTAASSAVSQVSQVSQAASSAPTVSVSDADMSLLMLVNKQNPLPDNYSINFTTIPTKYYIQSGVDFRLDSRAAPYMTAMLDAAKKDGVNIGMVCGYRSNATQATLYQNKINTLMKTGVTSATAESEAAQAVAPPGYSEHASGLAADLAYNGNSYLDSSYENTPAFTWLSAHAAEYGFILRYPKDKTSITQYEYEPWHYRFVGVENAQKIKASGLCLEEYVNQIKSASSKGIKSTSSK